jgi:hypothetical protein
MMIGEKTELLIKIFVLVVLIPSIAIYYRYSSESQESVAYTKADQIAQSIVDAVNSVYYYGEGSQNVLTIDVPDRVSFIEFTGKEMIIGIENLEEYILLKLRDTSLNDKQREFYKTLDFINNSTELKEYISKLDSKEFESLLRKFLILVVENPNIKFIFDDNFGLIKFLGTIMGLPKILLYPAGFVILLLILIVFLTYSETKFNQFVLYFFKVDINDTLITELKKDLYSFIDFIKNKKNEPINKIDLPIKKNERQI